MSFTAAINEIREMTENNHITDSYIAGCELIGEPANAVKEALIKLRIEQERRHEVTPNMDWARYLLYKDMKKIAEGTMTANEYNMFIRSF